MIRWCQSCEIGQTFPQPPQDLIGQYYPEAYFPIQEPPRRYYRTYIQRFQKEKIAKLGSFRRTGRILDIGCGVGYFIKEAIEAGYEAEGIEFSERAAAEGGKRYHLKITSADFLVADVPRVSFDIVTLWQVFEHFHEPKQVLRKIHQTLKSRGLLVIAVPNITSIQARIFRSHWYHLEVPRHLYHYSPKGLSSLVEQFGFKVKKIDHYSHEHNGSGFLGSVIRLAGPNEPFLHKLFRKTLGMYISNTIAWIESTFGRGGTFILFAVKE